jgi:transposase InsO family protein
VSLLHPLLHRRRHQDEPTSRGTSVRKATICHAKTRKQGLNSLYKRELIDPKKDWQGVDDVMLATMDWVQWYNENRIHSYSGDMPPRKYEEIYYRALESGN